MNHQAPARPDSISSETASREGGRVRLFCFGYAGGGASIFRPWASRFSPSVEMISVQLPGREERFRERAHRRMGPLIDQLAIEIGAKLTRPFAFFGYSMGALVAYEFARRLEETGRVGPALVAVGAHRAPRLPRVEPPLHALSSAEFWSHLNRYGGVDSQVMGDERLREVFEPTLRADFEVVETYRHRPGPSLRCPVLAFAGRADAFAAPDAMRPWGEVSSGGFELVVFDGGHFFLRSEADAMIRSIETRLGVSVAC